MHSTVLHALHYMITTFITLHVAPADEFKQTEIFKYQQAEEEMTKLAETHLVKVCEVQA